MVVQSHNMAAQCQAHRLLLAAAAAAAASAAASAAPAFDCSFSSSYPRTYVAYRNFDRDIVIDGKLDDAAWSEVGFTDDFVDISTATTPRLRTNVKMRFDDDFLYVGARLEEPQVSANITYTCHCNTESGDQVIFHDNDFEIFVDADGGTHNYKEYEMNAANGNGTSATWDLLLDKTYTDGGGENSSRVFGAAGWDMIEPRDRGHCRTFTDGVLNEPASAPTFWSAEVALPLNKLAELTYAAGKPVKSGVVWRINFSRVEWAQKVVDGKYQKYPSCQSCPDPGGDHEASTRAHASARAREEGRKIRLALDWTTLKQKPLVRPALSNPKTRNSRKNGAPSRHPEQDNWVWSPQGAIAMHQPETWGWLQFEDGDVNSTAPATNPEWPARSAAMVAYYAQRAYAAAHNGSYAPNVAALLPYASVPQAIDGTCAPALSRPTFQLDSTATHYNCSIAAGDLFLTIRDDRLIRVASAPSLVVAAGSD